MNGYGNRKLYSMVLGSSITVIIAYIVEEVWMISIPSYVASAITIVVAFVLHRIIPDMDNGDDKQ